MLDETLKEKQKLEVKAAAELKNLKETIKAEQKEQKALRKSLEEVHSLFISNSFKSNCRSFHILN